MQIVKTKFKKSSFDDIFLFTDENTLTTESEMSKGMYVYLYIPNKKNMVNLIIYNFILKDSLYLV